MLPRLALALMVALLVGPLRSPRHPNLLKTTESRHSEPAQMPGTRPRSTSLGMMYASGEGAPQDAVEAVAWLDDSP